MATAGVTKNLNIEIKVIDSASAKINELRLSLLGLGKEIDVAKAAKNAQANLGLDPKQMQEQIKVFKGAVKQAMSEMGDVDTSAAKTKISKALNALQAHWNKETKTYFGAGKLTKAETKDFLDTARVDNFAKAFDMAVPSVKRLGDELGKTRLYGKAPTMQMQRIVNLQENIKDMKNLQKVATDSTKALKDLKVFPELKNVMGISDKDIKAWERFSKLDVAAQTKANTAALKESQVVQKELLKIQQETEKMSSGKRANFLKMQAADLKENSAAAEQAQASLNKLAEANKKLTAKGGYQLLTGSPLSGKAAAASGAVFQKEFDRAQTEALKLNSLYSKLSQSLAVSPQTISSWNMTNKEMKQFNDNLAKGLTMASSKQIGGKQLTDLIGAMRSGQTFKGSGLGQSTSIDTQGLQSMLKYYDDLKVKSPQAAAAMAAAFSNMGVQIEAHHGKLKNFIESVKSYASFQIKFYAGMALIFGTIGAITAMGKAMLEFEQTLKNIQAVTGATDKEIAQIADTAKRLSTETPLAATEIAKLGLQLMRAGLNAEETNAAMEAAAKIATISGEDLKTVADTVATVFKVWKLGAEDTTRAGTVLAAALNYSKLTIQDLGTAFNYVGGMAATMGISLEETAGVLASLSNIGVRASTMATGWRQFVTEMAAPSKKLQKILMDLGVELNKVNILDLSGPNKMIQIMEELNKKGFGAQQAMEGLDRRASAFYLAMRTIGVSAMADMIKSMSDMRAYNEGLARVMEGPIAMAKRFWSTLQNSAIEIGRALMPVIGLLIDSITLLSTAIYHNVHFLTTWPGMIIVVVIALMLLRKTFLDILALNLVAELQTIGMAFVAMGKILLGVASAGQKVREIFAVLSFLGPGGWIAKLAGVGIAIAGGTLLDKLFGGESKIKEIQEMSKKLEENRQKMQSLTKQYGEFGLEGTENVDMVSQSIKEMINSIEQYHIPKITITADTSDAQIKFMELTKQAKDLGVAIQALETRMLNISTKTPLGAKDVRGISTLGAPSTITPFVGFPTVQPPVKIPTIEEQLALTHFKDQKAMQDAITKYKANSVQAAKEIADATAKLEKSVLTDIDNLVSKTLKPSHMEQYKEMRESLAKQYVTTLRADGQEKALTLLKAGIEELAKLRDKAAKDASKGIVTDNAKELAAAKDKIQLWAKNYQGQIDQETRLREVRSLNLQKDYELTKINMGQLSALNEEYYQIGIQSAQAYYAEKERLMTTSAKAEIDYLTKQNASSNIELGNKIKASMDQVQQLSDLRDSLLVKSTGKGKSTELEGFRKEAEDTIPLILAMGQAADKYQDEIDKGNESLKWQNQIINANLKVSLEAIRIQKEIALAQQPNTWKKEELGLQKDILGTYIEANELIGNWTAVETSKIELLKLEEKIALINIALEKDKLAVLIKEAKVKASMTGDQAALKHLEEQLSLYGDLEAIINKVYNIKKNEAQLKQASPIGYAIQQVNDEWTDSNKYLIEIADKTYRELASSFSNIFFDALKGKLTSLKDYFQSIFDSILRYFTDMLGRMAAQNLMGAIMGQGGGTAPGGMSTVTSGATIFTGLPGFNVMNFGAGTTGTGTNAGLFGAGGFMGLGGGLAGLYNSPAGWTGNIPALAGNVLGLAGGLYGMYNAYANGPGGVQGGLQGAMSGAMAGTAIVPGWGTLIGAIIGGIAGALGGAEEAMPIKWQMGYKGTPVDMEHGAPHSYGDWWTSQGGDEDTKVFTESVRKSLVDMFTHFRDSLKDFVTATGGDLANFDKEWKSKAKTWTSKEDMINDLNSMLGAYGKFLTGIDFEQFQKGGEQLGDTVLRIVDAIMSIPDLTSNIDDFISAIMGNDDTIALAIEKINEFKDSVKDLWTEYYKMTDPADKTAQLVALKTATVALYQAQKQMIDDLIKLKDDLIIAQIDFSLSMQEKINDLKGGTYAVGAIPQTAMDTARSRMEGSKTAQEGIIHLNEYITALDKWVDQNVRAIEASYNAQKKVNQDQIDALQKQLDLAQDWLGVLDMAKKSLYDLQTTSANPADVLVRLGIAGAEVDRLKGLYGGATGAQKAAYGEQLGTAVGDYIKIAQEAYARPSEEYKAIWESVKGVYEMLQSDAQAYTPEDTKAIQTRIATLQEANNVIDTAMAADIAAFKLTAVPYYEWAQKEGAKLYTEAIAEVGTKIASILGDMTYEEYIAKLQSDAVIELGKIKGLLQGIYDSFATGGALVPAPTETPAVPTVPTGGGVQGNPYTPGSWLWSIWNKSHPIQQFAEGGSFMQPTYLQNALFGEKRVEHVLDESRLVRIVREASRDSSNGEIHIHAGDIHITTKDLNDPDRLAKKMSDAQVASLEYAIDHSPRLRKKLKEVR